MQIDEFEALTIAMTKRARSPHLIWNANISMLWQHIFEFQSKMFPSLLLLSKWISQRQWQEDKEYLNLVLKIITFRKQKVLK